MCPSREIAAGDVFGRLATMCGCKSAQMDIQVTQVPLAFRWDSRSSDLQRRRESGRAPALSGRDGGDYSRT